jgi:hypothetical protein
MPRTGQPAGGGLFVPVGAALLALGLVLGGARLVRRGRAGPAMHR